MLCGTGPLEPTGTPQSGESAKLIPMDRGVIATVNDIRVIVSWNFRHMVNIDRKQKINSVNLREGLPLVDLVSPWEISYEEA